jgi:hypothetical protein
VRAEDKELREPGGRHARLRIRDNATVAAVDRERRLVEPNRERFRRGRLGDNVGASAPST